VAARVDKFSTYDARRAMIIVLAGAVAAILVVLLPPWSPVSPWRAPLRLGGCAEVTLYTDSGARYHHYEQGLRRRVARRSPGTTLLVVAGDPVENLILLRMTDLCAATISPPAVLKQSSGSDGQWLFDRRTVLWRLSFLRRDGNTPYPPDALLVNEDTDAALIDCLWPGGHPTSIDGIPAPPGSRRT